MPWSKLMILSLLAAATALCSSDRSTSPSSFKPTLSSAQSGLVFTCKLKDNSSVSSPALGEWYSDCAAPAGVKSPATCLGSSAGYCSAGQTDGRFFVPCGIDHDSGSGSGSGALKCCPEMASYSYSAEVDDETDTMVPCSHT